MPKTLSSTKHFQIASALRQEIALMRPGDTLPTLEELMKRFSASQSTMDRALARLRQEGMIRRKMGRQRLTVADVSDRAARRVALIRPDFPSSDYEEIAQGIVMAGRGCNWAFDLVYYRRLNGLDLWHSTGDCDAAVLLPDAEPFPHHLEKVLRRPHKPVALIQEVNESLPVSSVCIDEPAVGRMAVEHLLSLGHRRILAVNSEPPTRSALGRIAGWREALAAAGVCSTEELFFQSRVQPAEDSMSVTYEHFREWLGAERRDFTAIFVVSARGAMSVMRALRDARLRVPEDVSVVAYAGEAKLGPFLSPPLTAIESDREAYSKSVVRVLEGAMADASAAPMHVRIPPYLVVRQSTGRCCRRMAAVAQVGR